MARWHRGTIHRRAAGRRGHRGRRPAGPVRGALHAGFQPGRRARPAVPGGDDLAGPAADLAGAAPGAMGHRHAGGGGLPAAAGITAGTSPHPADGYRHLARPGLAGRAVRSRIAGPDVPAGILVRAYCRDRTDLGEPCARFAPGGVGWRRGRGSRTGQRGADRGRCTAGPAVARPAGVGPVLRDRRGAGCRRLLPTRACARRSRRAAAVRASRS